MRVLRVISSVDPRTGGPAEAARLMNVALARSGVHVDTLTLDANGDGVPGFPGVLFALGPSLGRYSLNFQLIRWLREHAQNYHAVLVDGVWQYHSLAVYIALANLSIPYYVYTHGMLDPWFKTTYRLKHLKKLIYWTLIERRVLKSASGVIFTCEEERRQALISFPSLRCRGIIAPLGVERPVVDDQTIGEITELWPELRGKRVVLFLGRLHEKKGCDLLLRAFGRFARDVPSVHLLIVGPGQPSYVEKLKQLAVDIDIGGRVTWTGMLRGKRKFGALKLAEVFCLPSHQENFGVVVVEALASGTPVLISDKVNIWREIISDGAGLSFSDTEVGCFEALRHYLELDEGVKAEMSANAENSFRARFQIDAAAATLKKALFGQVAP